MRKLTLLALAILGVTVAACGRKSPTEPGVAGNLTVFVSWQGQGLAGRQLEILELHLVETTDARGFAGFDLLPGRYTLRARVNVPGPRGYYDQTVDVPAAGTLRVDVRDCLPCM